jgi:hypothetical protein
MSQRDLREHLSLVVGNHSLDFFELFPFQDKLKGLSGGQDSQT